MQENTEEVWVTPKLCLRDINGTIFNSCLGSTLRLCQIVFGSMLEHAVSCQGVSCLLCHAGAMSDVPGDVEECCGRQGVLGPCKCIL